MLKIGELIRVDNAMRKFGGLPDDYGQFITDEVLPTYIFYDGKAKTGYCTTCKSDFSTKGMKLKHKAETVCPSCGRKAIARSAGMKRGENHEVYWSALFQPDGENVLSRSFRHILDLTDYRNPSVETFELFRTIHTGNGSEDFMWWYDQKALREHWIPYKESVFSNYMYPRTGVYYLPQMTSVYGDLSKIAENSPALRYCPIKELLALNNWYEDGKVYGFSLDACLNFHRLYPYAEKLLKVGLTSLVKCLAHRDYDYKKYFDHTQTELVKILGLDKRRYEILRSVSEPVIDDLRLLQDYPNISKADFYWLKVQQIYGFGKGWLRTAMKYTSVEKIAKRTVAYDKAMYTDYLNQSERLGVDLHDEYYLFPKDLHQAHDRTYLDYLRVTDPERYAMKERENALIAAASKEKSKFAPFGLHYGGLFIKVADSADALRREGEVLHHCVATYSQKVANGETTILFIRREDKPDEPFFTMEWNGKIIQLRGSRNCAPTKEVEEFRKAFEEAVDEEYSKNKKQAKAA